jgi:hypothetical protein
VSVLNLPPMPADADPVKVPGLLHWLGIEQPQDEPETYEQYLERISREPQ